MSTGFFFLFPLHIGGLLLQGNVSHFSSNSFSRQGQVCNFSLFHMVSILLPTFGLSLFISPRLLPRHASRAVMCLQERSQGEVQHRRQMQCFPLYSQTPKHTLLCKSTIHSTLLFNMTPVSVEHDVHCQINSHGFMTDSLGLLKGELCPTFSNNC